MTLETFFKKFDLFADAPDAVARMRELVLRLATSGRLAEQDPADQSGSELLSEIFAIRDDLISRGIVRGRTDGNPIPADDTFELPRSWARCMISEVCDLQTGATPSRTEHRYFGGDIPWLVSGDINKGEINACDGRITKEGLENSNCKIIRANSVLIALNGQGKTRATVALLRTPAALNQSLVAMIPYSEKLLPEYIFWNLRGRYHAIRDITGQDQRRGLNMKLVGQLTLPIPPLAEQKRIVAKVDELMALCDGLEAHQQERESRERRLARAALARFAEAPTPANLDWLFHSAFSVAPAELRKSILTLALQGKLVPQDPNDEPAQKLIARLTPRLGAKGTRRPRRETVPVPVAEVEMLLPSGWASTTLETLADVNWGNTSLTKSSYTESGFPAYSATGPDGFIDHAEFSGPGIVLSAIGARSGKCFLASGEWTAIKNTITILPHDPIDTDWLFLVTNIEDAWKRRGGAQPFIALKDALTFGVRVPPLAEQRRIVAKVDELMAWVDALENQLTTARSTAKNLLAAAVAELTNTGGVYAAAEV